MSHEPTHPNQHPDEPEIKSRDETPKFGRLLLVLVAAVALLGVITFVSEAYYR